MSLKTPQEKLEYAKQMLRETKAWASPASSEVKLWKRLVSKFRAETKRVS
jgi:hypothetical protein